MDGVGTWMCRRMNGWVGGPMSEWVGRWENG